VIKEHVTVMLHPILYHTIYNTQNLQEGFESFYKL